jgi:CelD/BcsL family acetyltransferase involved in cellulose biosynthesis
MQLLTRDAALAWIEHHAALLDAPAASANPFSSSAWLAHFVAQVIAEDERVAVVEAEAGGRRCAMLLKADARSPGRYVALANYYASLYAPMAGDAPDRPAAARALVAAVGQVRPRAVTVQLAPLDAETADTTVMAEAFAGDGWYLRRYTCFGNWTLPCAGLTFDAYLAGRDSQLRNTLARKQKKLLSAGTLEIATRPDEVDRAMDAYDAVYARSWKQPEPYPGFVRGWARQCAARGWLRLGVARIGDEPVAAQFWFTLGGRASIFKLAYDEAQSKWSAGTVLTAHLMRHALEVDRVVEVDYLTGDDPYKRAWMTHRRERVGLIACNLRSPLGLVAAATEVAAQATARWRHRRAAAVA